MCRHGCMGQYTHDHNSSTNIRHPCYGSIGKMYRHMVSWFTEKMKLGLSDSGKITIVIDIHNIRHHYD